MIKRKFYTKEKLRLILIAVRKTYARGSFFLLNFYYNQLLKGNPLVNLMFLVLKNS